MESTKDNAAPAAASGAGVGGSTKRQRFQIELKPGHTTIVSWKQLLQKANSEALSPESEAESDAEDYIQVEKSIIRGSGSLEKGQQITARNLFPKSTNELTKRWRKDRDPMGEKDDVQLPAKLQKRGHEQIKAASNISLSAGSLKSECSFESNLQNPINSLVGVSLKRHSDPTNTLDCFTDMKTSLGDAYKIPVEADKDKTGSHSRDIGRNIISSAPSAADQNSREKKTGELDSQSRSLMTYNKKKDSSNELPDLNLPYTGLAPRTASMPLTNASKSKGKMLDRAIMRLEKTVENSKTPWRDVQKVDASSAAGEQRLPQQLIKQLAKVAKLAELVKGKIPEELTDRLMSILGNYVHRKTLKKLVREMVLEKLYASKVEDNNFQRIKKEIVEMIRQHPPSLKTKFIQASEHHDGLANDYQDAHASEDDITRGIYCMDNKVEDKLCDLYDAYIQGLDEDIGRSLVRKLYVQLAALWPKDTMDNHGIRQAICQAKERKKVLSRDEKAFDKSRDEMLSTQRSDDMIHVKACTVTQPPAMHVNLITDTGGLVQTSINRNVSSMPIVDQYHTAHSRMSRAPSKNSTHKSGEI